MEGLVDTYKSHIKEKVNITSSFWKSLFSITSEQVLMIDTKGRVLFTNQGLFDVSAKEVVGRSIFLLVPSAYAIILKNKLEEVNKVKSKVSFESTFETRHGRRNVNLAIDPVYDNNKILKGYSLASTDTTEIKLTQRKYNYKLNLEKLFLNISTKFINLPASNIDGGIEESLELISRFTNSEHAYIMLFNDESSTISYEWHSVLRSNNPYCSIEPIKKFLLNSVYQLNNSEPILIKTSDANFGLTNDCPLLVNPMLLEGKRYGALILVGKVNSEDDWSEDFAKPMMLFSNVFINTLERKKSNIKEDERSNALEKAIKQRTIAIENQKNKLVYQANELAKTEALLRQANDKLKLANSSLEKTVSQRTSSLEKTNQELDRFVYSVSHDIKAPLASVKGLINLVRLSPREEIDNSLNLMDRSIDKLNGFVEDILTHSRNSRVDISPVEVNFAKEIELAAEGLRYMHNANNVKLITFFNEKSKAVTDQYRLQSVLKNLISNAVKYHNPAAKKSWIKIAVETSTEKICIKISDNGIGIDSANVDKIFDMFYRASDKSFGSGLGLYIVKETIDKLRGTITVASQENVGTTFSLNIPNLV
ncbi:MAG: PAS domain-containing sensor histidine kinase [Cyclobacteriaceae bacterium]|nr:PAS domain-containing sensor histidine kinase [Cyclobacteriaceae bacterium]